MSAQGFYRFAAADTASDAFRPKAISLVMAGGLLSAVIGPQLVKVTAQSMVVPFLGTYLAVIALNLVGMFLFIALRIPKPRAPGANSPVGRTRLELIRAATDGCSSGLLDGAASHGSGASAEIHRGGDLRRGVLRADEPCDDLVALGRRRLRV